MGRVTVREYDGSEDPNLWIAHVKRVTAANNWDEERAIAHAMAALTGPAALWLESEGSEVETIAELKQGLVQRFRGANFSDLVDAQLRSMKQLEGENVAGYANRFQYLHAQGGSELAGHDAYAKWWIRGLRGSMAREVMLRSPVGWFDAVHEAKRIEHANLLLDGELDPTARLANVLPTSSRQPRPSNNVEDELLRIMARWSGLRERDGAQGRGHRGARPSRPERQEIAQRRFGGGARPGACNLCGEHGHWKNECPQRWRQDSDGGARPPVGLLAQRNKSASAGVGSYGQRGGPRNASGRQVRFDVPDDDLTRMGYAARAPTSVNLDDDGDCVRPRYASTGTDDETDVWDSYLSYLSDCARDSGATARSALPGDSSDTDDADEHVRADDVTGSSCARANLASTGIASGYRSAPVRAMAYDGRKRSRGEAGQRQPRRRAVLDPAWKDVIGKMSIPLQLWKGRSKRKMYAQVLLAMREMLGKKPAARRDEAERALGLRAKDGMGDNSSEGSRGVAQAAITGAQEYVTAELNGLTVSCIILDPGSTYSLIDATCAEYCHVSSKPAPDAFTIELANGAVVNPAGISEACTFRMLGTTTQIRFCVMRAERAYDVILGQDWLARVAAHTAHYSCVYEVAGQYVVQCDRRLRVSTRQEYCAGSVSVERDAQGGSDARRHTIELGNDTHDSRDSNSDSDSNCDSGDNAMFEEVFA